MKRALIVHGWESGPKEHWYQDEKNILEERGCDVLVPEMPGGSFVREEEWVDVIRKYRPNGETTLIGHSLGVPTILRYLESADAGVDKVILIAGFASPLTLDYPNEEYPRKFVERPFDWDKIKQMATKFVVMNQVDDPWVPLSVGEDLAKRLGVEMVRVEGDNHFDTMDLDLINRELT